MERDRVVKHWFMVAGASLALFATASAASGQEVELRQAFDHFARAFVAADVETLATLVTDDYVHTNSGSRPLGREEWLDWIAGRREHVVSGELVYDHYATEELAIRLHQDAAVLTGRVRGHGHDGGRPFAVDVRFTQLWVREGGDWRRAAFHDAATVE